MQFIEMPDNLDVGEKAPKYIPVYSRGELIGLAELTDVVSQPENYSTIVSVRIPRSVLVGVGNEATPEIRFEEYGIMKDSGWLPNP